MIFEGTLAPDDPEMAYPLKGLVKVLRKTGRDAEAAPLEARASALRATKAPR